MTTTDRIQIIEDFIDFCKLHLSIKELPKMTFIEDRSWVLARHSFGEYTNSNKAIVMYIKNRNLADVLRTLSHELCHHRQNELGLLYPGAGETGSPVENEANIVAGMILRAFGKTNEMIYESTKLNILKQLLIENNNTELIQIIPILNNLKKIIPKFNIIGGAAYHIHVPNSETPKDIDIITNKINPSYLDKKGISDYQIYQSSFNDPGQVSDFLLNGFNIQIVDPRYNDWESFREFEFENINGFQVATLDSIIDNTISSKVKKYSNLPILKKWSFKEYIKFLNKLKNNENRKNLIFSFFTQNLSDEDFDNNIDNIRDIVHFDLNKENIKIFQKLYNQINNNTKLI